MFHRRFFCQIQDGVWYPMWRLKFRSKTKEFTNIFAFCFSQCICIFVSNMIEEHMLSIQSEMAVRSKMADQNQIFWLNSESRDEWGYMKRKIVWGKVKHSCYSSWTCHEHALLIDKYKWVPRIWLFWNLLKSFLEKFWNFLGKTSKTCLSRSG
jgi:hypothetical protein